jgi:hypothetical protein
MIVVSASLKKSGSGWYFNLTNDLLAATGGDDVRALREEYGLHDVLQGENCQVNPRPLQLARLYRVHRRGHSFVVKTHAAPTPSLRLLLRMGAAAATYIYRDPRDVVLSALDHGRRARVEAPQNVLARLHTVEDAARYVRTLLDEVDAWTRRSDVLLVRYEDLQADPAAEVRRLAAHLRLEVDDGTAAALVGRYDRGALSEQERRHLHFNKGVSGRFAEEMSAADRAVCDRLLGRHLARLGYAS